MGKTYGKSGPLAVDVTIDRMAQDGFELSEFLRAHLHQQKIILLGLSWGSVLGVHMVKMRPELFYAYVGTGQMVSEAAAEPLNYASVLQKARDTAAMRKLSPNSTRSGRLRIARKPISACIGNGLAPMK